MFSLFVFLKFVPGIHLTSTGRTENNLTKQLSCLLLYQIEVDSHILKLSFYKQELQDNRSC